MKVIRIDAGDYSIDSDLEMGRSVTTAPFCGSLRHIPLWNYSPLPAIVQPPFGRGAYCAYGNSPLVIVRDELRRVLEKELPEAIWGKCLTRGRKDGTDAATTIKDKDDRPVFFKAVLERSSMYVPPEYWLDMLEGNDDSNPIDEDPRRFCEVCGFPWLAALEGMYPCAYPRAYFERRRAGMFDSNLFLRSDLFEELKLAKGSRVEFQVVKHLYTNVDELHKKFPTHSFWSRTRGRVC